MDIRIYADCRPNNLKVAQLQKGIVLVFNGTELIEEGAGIGVPVAIFSDETFFSSSAVVRIIDHADEKVVMKHFLMDSVSRKSWKIEAMVNNPVYNLISRFFAAIYRDYPMSRIFILPIMRLRDSVGINTRYMRTEQRGEVVMTYSVKRNGLSVKADMTKLNKKSLKRVILLNEQGSTFFRRFSDSSQSILVDDAIESWDLVKADWAYLSTIDNSLSFGLKRLPNCKLFRGRENIKGYLAWAGMEYELNPQTDFISYEVLIRVKEEYCVS